jgi:hypothetical protein
MASDAVGLTHPLGVAARPSTPAAARATRGIRPVAALRFAIVCMLVGNVGRIPVFSAGSKDAPLLFNELVLGATLVLAGVACVQARSLRLDRVAVIALAFAGIGALSAVLGAAKFGLAPLELGFSLAYLARWVAYFGVYVVIVNTATEADAPGLWRAYERTALAFALFGIVQSIFLPGFAQMVFPSESSNVQWDKQGHRLVSTLLDPNFAGAFVLLPFLVLLARLSHGERVRPWKLAVLLAALLMTVSRSSVLALIAGLAVIASVRGVERRLLRAAAFGTAALLPFVPLLLRFAVSFDKLRVDDSAMLRVVSWLRALTVFADNPWIGVGFNTYGFVQGAYGFEAATTESGFTLDGGLLFIAVMTGVVGVALYFWMIRVVLRRCRALWRDASRAPEVRGTALGVGAGTVAILVHSVFVNSLLLPFLLEALWLLWGLVFLHARRPPVARRLA